MKQAPSLRICHAARYQSRLTITDRVQVFDRGRWRPVDANDSATTCTDNRGRSANDASVIAIPKHLLKRWWRLEESGDGDRAKIAARFKSYAREVAEYFNYKDWALPPDAVMEVVASDGERDAAPQPSRATRFSSGVGTLRACINLGDENLMIVLGAESARIRVILEPGEGVMIPACGILWSRSAAGSSDPAITLLIGSLSAK